MYPPHLGNMMKAMVQYWDPSYRCFTFGEIDFTPTIEEYRFMLHLKRTPLPYKHIRTERGLWQESWEFMRINSQGGKKAVKIEPLMQFVQANIHQTNRLYV